VRVAMDTASGTVAQLWRWPVKSMAGERVDGLRVDGRGAGGDRTHAVLHQHKGELKPLTAREAPRLLAWEARYPFNLNGGLDPARPPFAVVRAPDGRSFRWGDPRLRHALADDLGRPVELRRDVEGIQDLPRTLLITFEATLQALGEELHGPIDLRRFRTNLHLDMDAPGWAECEWEGRELAFEGGVRLKLLHPCERCAIPTRHPDTQVKWPYLLRHLTDAHGQNFGINARVVAGGRIGSGEAVELVPPSGSRASGR
jgi:MOSC domain-containing protein